MEKIEVILPDVEIFFTGPSMYTHFGYRFSLADPLYKCYDGDVL